IGELDPIGVPRYVLCGALQLLVLVGLTVLGAFLASQGYEWVYKTQGLLGAGTRAGLGAGADPVGAQLHSPLFGAGVVSVYLRSALFVIVGFVLLCALPIVA